MGMNSKNTLCSKASWVGREFNAKSVAWGYIALSEFRGLKSSFGGEKKSHTGEFLWGSIKNYPGS